MRKILYLILLIGSLAFAQQNNSENNLSIVQNEISVNLPLTTFGQFPMFSYERLSSADLGYGASLGFGIGNEGIEYSFLFVPFVRWYFLNSGNETVYGRRIFIEANAGVIGVNDDYYDDDWYDYEEEDHNDVGGGLGLGIGYKYVNKSNWIGTIYLGGGKNFGGGYPEVYPHVGINIGKRF